MCYDDDDSFNKGGQFFTWQLGYYYANNQNHVIYLIWFYYKGFDF